jgi:hypothetical protein
LFGALPVEGIVLKKVFILLTGIAATVPAVASYELALMMGTNPAGEELIHRFDPVTSSTLGSFGGNGDFGTNGFGTSRLAVSKQYPGQVEILNADGAVRRFDYSTGLYKGGFSTGQTTFFGNGPMSIITTNTGYVYTGYTGPAPTKQRSVRLNNAGGFLGEFNPFGPVYEPLSVAESANGNLHVLNRVQSAGVWDYYIFSFNSQGGYLGFSNLGANASGNLYGSIQATGNNLLIGPAASNTTRSMVLISQTPSSSPAAVGGIWNTGAGWTRIAKGHNGRLHWVQSTFNAGTYINRWHTYDPLVNNTSSRLMPYTGLITDIDIVVAPEPGTLAILGLGGLILARRKKKS